MRFRFAAKDDSKLPDEGTTMSQRRYERTDFEGSIIEPLRPTSRAESQEQTTAKCALASTDDCAPARRGPAFPSATGRLWPATTARVTEQLALQPLGWDRRAVDRNEGSGPRLPWRWMARATTSFPVPVSPVMRTVASLPAQGRSSSQRRASRCSARVTRRHCWRR